VRHQIARVAQLVRARYLKYPVAGSSPASRIKQWCKYMDEWTKEKLAKISLIAESFNYVQIDYQASIYMVSFAKEAVRINIYLTKMTVATCIHHPKKGKTQLFRRNVDMKSLEKIFKNPRQHTGKGYYTK
jgi:hypothetical protein